jgi:hypothetical protein
MYFRVGASPPRAALMYDFAVVTGACDLVPLVLIMAFYIYRYIYRYLGPTPQATPPALLFIYLFIL